MQRIAQVIIERLQATRLRLLDVYGVGVAASDRARADPMLPEPLPGHRLEPGDRRHLDARARAPRPPEPLAFAPGQFNMLYAFGVGEVPISISGDPPSPGPLVHTMRAVGAGDAGDLRRARPATVLGVRGPFGSDWPVDAAEGCDVVIVAGGVGLAPLRPIVYEVLARRDRFGRVALLYGGREPDAAPLRARARAWRERGIEVDVTVDIASATWRGQGGRGAPTLIARAGFDPANAVAFICGPEVMMRFSAEALLDARARRRPHLRLDGAQHEVRGRPVRALPARARVRLPGRPRVPLRAHPPRVPDPGDLRWRRDAQAEARGLEVRLLRRLPAQPARLRGRAARARRRDRDRLLPRGSARDGRGPLRPLAGRGLDHHAGRPRADPEGPRPCRGAWSRSAPARPPAASRRCGTSPTSRSSSSVVYASPEYISTLETSTPISAHVKVDFELRGCPINKRQLLEVISAFLNERKPGDRRAQRLHRVQAARQRLRDGRARHALPRPGHARRLRRDLPRLRPRLLRLLRADGDARTPPRLSRLVAAARRDRRPSSCASSGPSTPSAEPFREREASAHEQH